MLIRLTVVINSQRICISNHVICLKYIQFLFKRYINKKDLKLFVSMDAMKKVRKQPTGWEKLQIMYTHTHTHT